MLGRFRKVFSKLQGLEAEAPAEPDPSSPPDPPVLDFRTFGEVLTFRTCCLLPVHEEFEAPAGPDHVLVLNPRTRRVLAEDPLEVEYTADVCGSDGALEWLRSRCGIEVVARGGHEERRAVARLCNRIRVRSRHLPCFQGMTHDLSEKGVRLVTEGELAPGTALELDIQLDHDRLPDVKARGEIIWTRPLEEGRTWWLGVRLDQVEDPQTLKEYVAELSCATDCGLTRKNFLDS
ncbi:MAG: PilZ domain-containing protein [Candidatus Xenobium sp.]|jgi:hypothetical protein|nr:hypothetical protein [Burkholderiales bacterium]